MYKDESNLPLNISSDAETLISSGMLHHGRCESDFS